MIHQNPGIINGIIHHNWTAGVLFYNTYYGITIEENADEYNIECIIIVLTMSVHTDYTFKSLFSIPSKLIA